MPPQIIGIVFGNDYGDSVLSFRILAVGYFFAGTFRIPAGNMLGALRKVNVSLYNAMILGTLNIILDVCFILRWGANGAAISTACIYVVSALIVNGYMYYYLNKKEAQHEHPHTAVMVHDAGKPNQRDFL